jgi:hypothetical protein
MKNKKGAIGAFFACSKADPDTASALASVRLARTPSRARERSISSGQSFRSCRAMFHDSWIRIKRHWSSKTFPPVALDGGAFLMKQGTPVPRGLPAEPGCAAGRLVDLPQSQ